jgi:hypothetical protein
MSWPAIVLRKFAKVPAAASVADFPGPYNILLYSLFPPNTNFMVAPRWPPPSSLESTFMYEVVYNLDLGEPVLVLQLKAPGDLQSRSTREASDRQIRTRMTNLSGWYPKSSRILNPTNFYLQLAVQSLSYTVSAPWELDSVSIQSPATMLSFRNRCQLTLGQ